MSLLLVLAMVLAMVPAALAAETSPIKNEEAAPGQTLELKLPAEFNQKTYYWKAGNSYSGYGGSSGYLTVPYTTTASGTQHSNNVIVSSGIKQTVDNLYVYVYKTATAADKNKGFSATNDDKAIYAFKIKVTPWSIALAVDPVSSGFNNTLNPNGTVTLRATVTGPADKVTTQAVTFTINGTKGVATLIDGSQTGQKVNVTPTPTSATTTMAQVVLKAENVTGQISVSAAVTPAGVGSTVAATYPSNGTYIEVRSGASYVLTLVEENIYVTKGGTVKYIQPKLTRDGKQVTGSYTYTPDSKTNTPDATIYPNATMNIVVNPNGSIYPQVDETTAPVKVTVKEATSGLTKDCYINVVKSAATITDLIVNTDLSEKKFAKIPTDSSKFENAMKDMLTGTVNLQATVVSESDSAASRLVWTSSNEKIATVSKGSDGAATVTAVAPGKVTITATMPSTSGTGTSKSVDLYVWDTKAYKEIELPTKVSGPINDPYTTCVELAKQPLKAKLVKNNQIVNLNATYAYDYTSGKYVFKGAVDGIDAANKIVYYPTNACTALSDTKDSVTGKYFTFDAGKATISTIQIDGPKDASFKVNEKLGSLTCTIRTTDAGDFITTVVWKDKNNNTVQTDSTVAGSNPKIDANRTYYVSTLNLANKINSPGDYQYYCEITTTKNTTPIRSGIANVVVGGDYIISISGLPASVKVGDTITFTATPQQYLNGKYTDVRASNYTVSWTVSDTSVGTLNKSTGSSVSFSVKGGGKVTITAETTINGNKHTGTKEFTVTVPDADAVNVTLGENETYVQLDGSKLAAAVKTAAKVTPSTFTFESPANGTLYTSSAMSGTVSTTTKYSASEVSKMVYRPTRTTGTHTIKYAAYDGSAQVATGTINVMTSASTVEYHISANEKQQMSVSDFQRVYGSGLSTVTFGSNTDTRGALYKGSTTSSGKVGSESYSVSTGSNLLKNVYFIAGSTTSKYTVTIPFMASGSSGQMNGQLVVYVNDTHTLNSTGASFRSMGIANELTPDNATGSTYITIDRIVGGKLYSAYTSIKNCTALTSKDLGSTKFYFTGSGSLDNLYILPLADSKSVEISYTIDGSTKGTLSFSVNQQTASNQFTDVSGSYKWAANSVDFMYMNDIIKGNNTKNPKLFGPGAKMTRAMLVTVLYRAAGEPSVTGITNKFTDNKQGKYYYNAVLWASNKGIVNGATATTFDPDGNITREQIAAILYRYAGSPSVTGSLSGYSDQAKVSSFAVTAMQWAVGSGIITGVTSGGKTTLSAKGNATRAQVAVMLHRFLTFE